ncbi:MAG: hypothetical protein IIZ92_10180, partial [Aquincola sp.]|nr:hypothetical protein [Aquincola sp.]
VTSLYAHPPAAQPVAQGERDDDLASAWIAGRAETYAEIHPNATLAEAYQAGAEFALRSKGLQASRSSAQGAAQVPPHQGDAP